MPTVKSTRTNKIQIVIAGVFSILAQGLLLLPPSYTARLPLPDWGTIATGVTLFAIATIWIVSNIRSLKTGWRGNAHFILNQAVIVIGIFLLLDSSVSGARLGGFVLTSLITALTVYGIIANTSSPALILKDEKTAGKKEFTPPVDVDKNIEALKEQAVIATKKLNTEKTTNYTTKSSNRI